VTAVTVRISERAPSLADAFARAALAVLGVAVDPGTVEERDRREVRAHGTTTEALLAHWLNECLYVLDVEAFACRRIDFAVFDVAHRAGAEPMRLHAFLYGEDIDPARHRLRGAPDSIAVGAVTVKVTESGYEIDVCA
jgi:SHS2 domain-containing protein